MTTRQNIGGPTEFSSSAPSVELHQSLASRAAAISPFVDQLMRFISLFIRKFGVGEETKDEIEISIREALANAVIHGNHEDPEKHVFVICRCTMDGQVLIVVRDEGEGFDSQAVPDPTESQKLLLTHGRGLHIMRGLMDEVSFEENGRVVRMRKQIKPPVR